MIEFVDEYLKWLKNNITQKQIKDCVEISTPFLDRHNDWIQIYVEKDSEGKIYITDDGYILSDLKNCGIDISTESRKKIMSSIINGYGIKISENNELYATADKQTFPMKTHMLIQCMMSVSDLYLTSRSSVVSIFSEEVKNFFDLNDVSYIPDVSFTGKSGFVNKFDFAIPKSTKKERPLMLVKSINTPSIDNIKLAMFQWEDTREQREDDSKLILYLNDAKRISEKISDSCKSYGIGMYPWQKRNDSLSIVA